MGQEQFAAIMPMICDNLASMIAREEKYTEQEAIAALYGSKLYALLEQEETKVWQYSTPMLFSLWEQERESGELHFPDV